MKSFKKKFSNYIPLALFKSQMETQEFGYFSRLLQVLLCVVIFFSVVFYFIMLYNEGREYSWISCLYWTLTVMTTLGFGDITFTSNLGRFFTIIVLLSGVVIFLVMVPLTFTQYIAWLDAQREKNAPRILPDFIENHIIIVGMSVISLTLAKQLKGLGFQCVMLCHDLQSAKNMEGKGLYPIIGDYDDSNTYRNLRVEKAMALLAFDTDIKNSNIIFSAKEAYKNINIIVRAEHESSIDILTLAGSSKVFSFRQLLGDTLAIRVSDKMGYFTYTTGIDFLVVAEISINKTGLAGKTLRECELYVDIGVNILGIWQKGLFTIPSPDDILPHDTSIVIAGTKEQFHAFDTMLMKNLPREKHVIVLGAGNVGLVTMKALHKEGIKVTMVDKNPVTGLPNDVACVIGNASDISVLERAGINDASSVIVTTNDDDTNIYLTLHCRRLRSDIQIICRSTLDKNVSILHDAGANIVLSLMSLMRNSIINMLIPCKIFVLSEGFSIFRRTATKPLIGKTLKSCEIRQKTRCNILAVKNKEGHTIVNPPLDYEFLDMDEIYLFGDTEGENALYRLYQMKSLQR